MRKGKAVSHRLIVVCASNLLLAIFAHLLDVAGSVESLTTVCSDSKISFWSGDRQNRCNNYLFKRQDFLLSISWIYLCWAPPVILFQSVSQYHSALLWLCNTLSFFISQITLCICTFCCTEKADHQFQFLINGLLTDVVIISIIPVVLKFLWESFRATIQRTDVTRILFDHIARD